MHPDKVKVGAAAAATRDICPDEHAQWCVVQAARLTAGGQLSALKATHTPLLLHPGGLRCRHTDTHNTTLHPPVASADGRSLPIFVHTPQAKVLNPLLPMDFHNDVRVHVVPETEEFIKMIGHMASEEDIQYMQVGVQGGSGSVRWAH